MGRPQAVLILILMEYDLRGFKVVGDPRHFSQEVLILILMEYDLRAKS